MSRTKRQGLAGFQLRTGITGLTGLTFLTLVLAVSVHAKTLYVNGTTGNDATTWAANGPAAPWRTIGRAAWGSTNRSAPNPGEAAQAGDTVNIAGGTYAWGGSVNSRWGVVYNPTNNGTVGNYITFTCSGDCRLETPNANSPVIGSEGRSYIKWFADISQGHSWVIPACGLMTGCGSNIVNTTPDTGPVVCQGSTGCWVEGADIDGGPQTDYTDNYDGIRIENAPSSVIRNNVIRSFRNQANTSNGTCIKNYGSPNGLIEHNVCSNVGSAISFKDTGFTLPQNNIRVRYNRFEGVDNCVTWSMTAEDRNYVYQNLCRNARIGLSVTGGGLSNDWIFNNTFYTMSVAGVLPSGSGSGGRFWNNIVATAPNMINVENTPMPQDSVIDFEHNLYSGYSSWFYSGPEGRRTFVDYLSASPTQDQTAPASRDADPMFVNAGAGDFHLQGGSPALSMGVDLFDLDGDGSTTDLIPAGAYVTGTEVIGLAGGPPPPPPPPPPAPVQPLFEIPHHMAPYRLYWNDRANSTALTAHGIFGPKAPGTLWNYAHHSSGGWNNGPFVRYSWWDWDVSGVGHVASEAGWFSPGGSLFRPPGGWPVGPYYLRFRIRVNAPLLPHAPNGLCDDTQMKFFIWNSFTADGTDRAIMMLHAGSQGGGNDASQSTLDLRAGVSGSFARTLIPNGQWVNVQLAFRGGPEGTGFQRIYINNNAIASPTAENLQFNDLPNQTWGFGTAAGLDNQLFWGGISNTGSCVREDAEIDVMAMQVDDQFDPNWHAGSSSPNPCDVNTDGSTSVADVQLCVNQAIGITACATGDINQDSACNVVDVQRVVNAALGGACVQ